MSNRKTTNATLKTYIGSFKVSVDNITIVGITEIDLSDNNLTVCC